MRAQFVRACSAIADLPDGPLPEVAVAGRSNCGKSSLINAMTGHAQLARSSSTPGRTQQLIVFHVDAPDRPPFHLIDLPGYGYAKAPRGAIRQWGHLVDTYIENRVQLRALLLLNDLRREPSDSERAILNWAHQRGLATVVVLTKSDKLSKANRFGAVKRASQALPHASATFAVSVHDRDAVAALWEGMRHFLGSPPDPTATSMTETQSPLRQGAAPRSGRPRKGSSR